MPRIFKYGDIPNINLTPDKELNILIYRSPSYLIIYRSYILLKMVRFIGQPCRNGVVGRRDSSGLPLICLVSDIGIDNLYSPYNGRKNRINRITN